MLVCSQAIVLSCVVVAGAQRQSASLDSHGHAVHRDLESAFLSGRVHVHAHGSVHSNDRQKATHTYVKHNTSDVATAKMAACSEQGQQACWDQQSGCQGSFRIRGASHGNTGFGVTYFTSTILQLRFARHFCLAPRIDFDPYIADNYYDPAHGPNPWEYYFKPVQVLPAQAGTPLCEMETVELAKLIADGQRVERFQDKLSELHLLLRRFFQLNERTQAAIEAEWSKMFGHSPHTAGKPILGLHIRGTDRSGAVGDGPELRKRRDPIANGPDLFLPHVKEWLKANPGGLVFVATDDSEYENIVKTKWPADIADLVRVRDVPRGRADSIIYGHFASRGKFQEGFDCLADIVFLSRCDKILHGISDLGWAARWWAGPDVPGENLDIQDHSEVFFESSRRSKTKSLVRTETSVDSVCPRLSDLDLEEFRSTDHFDVIPSA